MGQTHNVELITPPVAPSQVMAVALAVLGDEAQAAVGVLVDTLVQAVMVVRAGQALIWQAQTVQVAVAVAEVVTAAALVELAF